MGDVVRGFLEGSVQLASQGRLGRIPPGLDERQGFPEVLRFGEGSCLRELVLDRGRIDLHLPARVDEGLALRQLLADVRLQQAEAPINAPREGGPRRSTSPASKATSPSWKNFSNFVESVPTS